MTTPVGSLLAKLLKEKGFDEPCKLCVEDGDERPLPFNCGDTLHKNSLHPYYSAPTIAEVVMWLYEKHGIWIVCTPFYIVEGKRFSADVFSADNKKTSISHYKTPTEAYEAVIKHALKKLI